MRGRRVVFLDWIRCGYNKQDRHVVMLSTGGYGHMAKAQHSIASVAFRHIGCGTGWWRVVRLFCFTHIHSYNCGFVVLPIMNVV